MKQVEVSWDCGCIAGRTVASLGTTQRYQHGSPLNVTSVAFGLDQVHATKCPFVPKPKRGRMATAPCSHCGRICGDAAGGWGSLNGEPLCHPNEAGRPDCYRLVTVYHHPLQHEDCAVTDGVEEAWDPQQTADALLAAVAQTTQEVRELISDTAARLEELKQGRAAEEGY